MLRLIRFTTFVIALFVASALLVNDLRAQIIPSPQPTPVPGQSGQLSNSQIRDIMALRGLQGRQRSGGVKTGVPQFVPFGGGGFGPGMPMQNWQPDPQPTTTKTSSQRRAEARKARAEEKKAAKEKADAEKAAKKAKGKAQPAAAKKPVGKAKAADPQA